MAKKMDLGALRQQIMELQIDKELKHDLLEVINEKKHYGLVWEESSEAAWDDMQDQLPVFVEDATKRLDSAPEGSPNHVASNVNLVLDIIIHLSPSPTFERQKRLEREGYITRYSAVVDHHKLGHNVIVLCNIRLKQHTHDLIQQFMDTVQKIDQITECYNTTGDYDFQIKVYAHDMKDYQDFMLNTLGNIDCIGSLHSIIVIGEIKDSHCIPVNRCLVK